MKKILGLLKSQTVKDSLIIFTGLGVMALIGLVFTVILARTLGPNTFGVFSAITALATIVYSLGDLGISPALINFIPKHLTEKAKYLTTGFWLQFAVAILVLLFFVGISLIHELVIPGSLAVDLLLAGGMSINYLFIGFAQGIFTAERRFWSYSLSQIIDPVIKITIVFILLRSNSLTIGSALAANLISTLLALLITFGKELYATEFEISREIVLKITHFAKWIAFSRIFSVMVSKVDVVLLNLMVGSFQTGIYSAASRLSFFFALLVSGLGSVVNARFSAFDSNKKLIAYSQKLLLLVASIIALMIFFVVLAGPLVTLIYGEKYLEAIRVFKFLTLAMIPFVFSLITTPALLYTFNLPAFYAWMTALQVSGIVILDIFLIPTLGALAPVIAMGITNLFVLVVSSAKLFVLINGKTLDRR